jgi:hypothetical protein
MNWRSNRAPDYERFRKWVDQRLSERRCEGEAHYGDTLQGSPLDQAIEGAVDLVFYLWKEQERQR